MGVLILRVRVDAIVGRTGLDVAVYEVEVLDFALGALLRTGAITDEEAPAVLVVDIVVLCGVYVTEIGAVVAMTTDRRSSLKTGLGLSVMEGTLPSVSVVGGMARLGVALVWSAAVACGSTGLLSLLRVILSVVPGPGRIR